ncbi:MAG: T9SS type A sorting domain-containing protein [Bacteroidia bacterium]|nr:T9SS type A sorting domain-containing protein [Bacteroidia bacterium]
MSNIKSKIYFKKNLDSLHAGVFANWDINIADENRARWDSTHQLAYIYDPKPSGLYGGLQLLTPVESLSYQALDNSDSSPVQVFDNFTDNEKRQLLSGGVTNINAGLSGSGKNVAHLLAGRLPNIRLGETKTIAFAFTAGNSLASLQNSALSAQARYRSLKTPPAPLAQQVLVCPGTSARIFPSPGSRFAFYVTHPDSSGSQPIHVGNSLELQQLTVDQTLYVINVDSVFDSDYTPVQVKVLRHQADFKIAAEEPSNWPVEQALSLENTSINGQSWQWLIRHEDAPANQDVIFLDNSTANSPNPRVRFTKLGDYEIKLISQSAQACQDSMSRRLRVFAELPTSLSPSTTNSWQLYPNPAREQLVLQTEERLGPAEIYLYDQLGRLQFRQPWPAGQSQITISLTSYAAGGYFLKIQEQGRAFVRAVQIVK